MTIQFLTKDQAWVPAKSKVVTLPEIEITVSYEDLSLGKMTPDQHTLYEQQLEKLFKAKSGELLSKAEGSIRFAVDKADKQIPTVDEAGAKSQLDALNNEIKRVCDDVAKSLQTAAIARIGEAYKTATKKAILVKVAVNSTVKVEGKSDLSADAATGIANAANSKEVAGKILTGLVYPSQDLAEGIQGDSQAASGPLDKAIKECNVLSKTMREAAKKSTPALEATIKTTATSLDKNLTLIEKFLSNSQSRARQLRTKITAVESQSKDLKDKDVTASTKALLDELRDLLTLLGTFANVSPLIEQLDKLSLKSFPDFPKYITILNRLNDHRPSNDVLFHLQRLGDFLAEAAKE